MIGKLYYHNFNLSAYLYSNIQNNILDNLDLECEGLSNEFSDGVNYAQDIIRAEFDKFIDSLEEGNL